MDYQPILYQIAIRVFTAKFWEALQEALGVQLLMSTTKHPQTDGQAEAAVKVIQKLLSPFVFQGQE
jgi:hypothetical protein